MNYTESEDNFPSLFSTQMHIVAEHILVLLDDDFYKMLKDRDSMAKEFISKTEQRLRHLRKKIRNCYNPPKVGQEPYFWRIISIFGD